MAQQEQLKKLILTDNKNILLTVSNQYNAYNLNFTTDGIRNFMPTKHKGYNAKLRN